MLWCFFFLHINGDRTPQYTWLKNDSAQLKKAIFGSLQVDNLSSALTITPASYLMTK